MTTGTATLARQRSRLWLTISSQMRLFASMLVVLFMASMLAGQQAAPPATPAATSSAPAQSQSQVQTSAPAAAVPAQAASAADQGASAAEKQAIPQETPSPAAGVATPQSSSAGTANGQSPPLQSVLLPTVTKRDAPSFSVSGWGEAENEGASRRGLGQ